MRDKHKLIYFWKNDAVWSIDEDSLDRHHIGYANIWCVDARYDDPDKRYGMFNSTGWWHRPLEEFPPEFRMHLLLEGVGI